MMMMMMMMMVVVVVVVLVLVAITTKTTMLMTGSDDNGACRFSLLTDVARGMTYLHKHDLVHGNLKSSNCVVDDRWTCKVAGSTCNAVHCNTLHVQHNTSLHCTIYTDLHCAVRFPRPSNGVVDDQEPVK